MIKHTTHCDKCGKLIKELPDNYNQDALRLLIDRHASPAGDMEDDYTNIELCSTCMINFMHFLFKKFDERFPGQLLQEFLKNK